MSNRKKYLTVLLIFLILLFIGLSVGGYYLIRYEKREKREIERLDRLADLKQAELERLTPTPGITQTPTPEPTASPTPTPTVRRVAQFNPDDFWDNWYSSNGRVSVNVYQIDAHSIGFSYHQISKDGSASLDASVSAEIAGNAAEIAFTDSWGNQAEGSLIFQGTEMYMKVKTVGRADGAPVAPEVSSVMLRTKPEVSLPVTETPVPEKTAEEAMPSGNGEYFFADSNSRYLTDEDMEQYTSEQLMLAKNEIYARHGREFVTDYIANYFAGKSWYQGSVSPEAFDEQQDVIFNEYELANIQKIAEWEERKRSQGQ